jgi:DNA-binding transcriptional ArsR family regulator
MTDRELKLLCRAVGDVSRMKILRTLAAVPEISVTELAYRLLMSQPLASWHLRILRRAGVITTRREGRQVYCALAPERIGEFREAVGDLVQTTEGKEQLWEKSALPSSA